MKTIDFKSILSKINKGCRTFVYKHCKITVPLVLRALVVIVGFCLILYIKNNYFPNGIKESEYYQKITQNELITTFKEYDIKGIIAKLTHKDVEEEETTTEGD